MRPVNTWGQYTHEASTHMRPELTWGQYTHEARIHMRPVHPWCQYTHEASIRMRPVHTWGQYTHEASTHMRLTSKSQDAVQCTVLKYITVYTRTLYSSFNVQVWLGCRRMLYIGERTPLAVVCIEYALWFRINKCIFHLNRFFFLLPHEYSVIYNKNCCSFNQCCKSTQHLF